MSALYQNYRPITFDKVKGQDAITKTLKNQVIAKRPSHAYLFVGVRGTGKTSIARILAKAVNCENPIDGNPCGTCPTCQGIEEKRFLNVIELDAASNNSVEDIRRITEEVKYRPTEGKYRVYIIDEVHMLSTGAFNALLKTLEEPPEYVIFILATTEAAKVPATIVSRCQRYDFKRVSITDIESTLKEVAEKEGASYEEEAISHIARTADGSMRDALSLLDRCMTGELTYRNVLSALGAVDTNVFSAFFIALIRKDIKSLMDQIEKIFISGKDLSAFVIAFLTYLRNLMVTKAGEVPLEVTDKEGLMQNANLCSLQEIMNLIKEFSDLAREMKRSASKRILLEAKVIIITQKMDKVSELKAIGNGKIQCGKIVPATNPELKPLIDETAFLSITKMTPEQARYVYIESGLNTMYLTKEDTISSALFKDEIGRVLKLSIPYLRSAEDVYELRTVLADIYNKYLEKNMYAINGHIYSCGHELIEGQWV